MLCTLTKVSTENVSLLNSNRQFTAVILLMIEVAIFLTIVGSTYQVTLAICIVEMGSFIDVRAVTLTYKMFLRSEKPSLVDNLATFSTRFFN